MLNNRHIQHLTWLLASMMTLMLTACSTSDEDNVPGSGVEQQKQPATLAVYVYAPEPAAAQKNAVRRRADVGNVDANPAAEGEIRSLQLWIYESETGNYVGYMDTEEVASLNSGEGALYKIPVSDDFAANKPDVDVYVQANIKPENCGVGTLNEETTRAALLNGAKIVKTKFGLPSLTPLTTLTTAVPTEGLPMAGHLTTQPVVGEAPALRVGSMSAVSTVQLTRAVSKLRFVFAKTTGQPKVSITRITMNAGMIPDEEYLFKMPESMTYNGEEAELLSSTIDNIAPTTNPTDYLYFDQPAQTYENLINAANLTVHGPIYLRESDKRLTGTISYSIAGVAQEPVTFQMQQAGDFLRNHTWIVYAYYAGAGRLQVQSLYVKDWSGKEMSHNFYNW